MEDILHSKTVRVSTGCGTLIVTVDELDGKVHEFHAKLGKNGSCQRAQIIIVAELLTKLIQSGKVDLDWIIATLENHSCASPGFHEGKPVNSCYDGFAKAVQKIKDDQLKERKGKESKPGIVLPIAV